MAPSWPEEVDVFSVPHSRMKKLVNKYSNMITTTDFRDEIHLTTLLKNLMNVFTEFKAHEQIENMLIMKKLKNKLKAASVTSAAVCNCHSDNRLTDMLDLVEDGYRWAHKTEQERQMYGKTLRSALDVFTQNFIPHMEEEEEVFQPMLMQYFSYEELKDLKAKVIHQHSISKQHEEAGHLEKFVEDSYKFDESSQQSPDIECHFTKLPNETCLQILSLLGPQELCRVGQVSQRFLQLSRDPSLWLRLYPVHWVFGNWSFSPEAMGGVDGQGLPSANKELDEDRPTTYACVDEDADIDETDDSDETESLGADALKQVIKEGRMLTAIVKYLLPHVGSGVKVCDLAFSKGLSSSLVHKILKLCPNLEVLDLTHTNVGDIAFKEFGESGRKFRLRHLDLTGCENITDMTLISLASLGGESSNLDDVDVEIENVPLPCAERLSVCCGKSSSCGTRLSGSCCNEEYHRRLTASDNNTCRVSNELSQCDDGNVTLQVFDSGTYHCPHSLNTEDPQTCDLNIVFMNLLLDEDLSTTDVKSFTTASSSITVSPESYCDNENCMKKSPSQGIRSPFTERTCSEVVLKPHGEKHCCKSFRDSVAQTVPHVRNSVNGNGRDSHKNHKRSNDTKPVECDKDISVCALEFLSLNGCYRISDKGLCALAEGEGTPHLRHLDLSGCLSVTSLGLSKLVSTSRQLDHSNLYYCDNMDGDPYFATASGCRNLQCETRFCCSFHE